VHWWRASLHLARGWFSARRVQPLLLAGGLRTAGPSELSQPELSAPGWLLPDAVPLFGAGPTLALVADARRTAHAPDDPVPEPIYEAGRLALETEAYWLRGDHDGCLRTGGRAREAVPASEALLRARIALRMAESALALGRTAEAWPLYDEVMQRDPGALVRLGRALPIGGADSGHDLGGQAAQLAAGGPRFVRYPGSPFRVVAQGQEVCLTGTGGNLLSCVSDPGRRAAISRMLDDALQGSAYADPPDARDLDDPVRRTALHFVRSAFAPRLDLSQQDLSTLDGTPLAERGIDPSVLDGLVERP
jgi:hypothetical protein